MSKDKKKDKKQPKLRQYSNTVLVVSEKSKKTLFLPAYLRVAFKKITQLDVQGASAEMSATVILTLYYKGLSRETIDYIKKNLDVAVNNEMFYNLDPDPNRGRNLEDGKVTATDDEKEGEYTVQWRNKFPLEMECDVFLTPFEVLELSITFALRSISWNQGQTKITVKMNFMDSPGGDLVTKFSLQQNQDFGEYGLAENMVGAKYVSSMKELEDEEDKKAPEPDKGKKPSKEESLIELEEALNRKIAPEDNQKKEQKAVKNWQYAHFQLAMYRYPFTTVLTVFLPILLLAIITLAIFFQDFGFAGRIASIATLMVAYSAFLPTVRESLPPSPNMTMFDVILYSLIFTSLLCLIRSWIDRERDTTVDPYDWTTDPFYIASVVIVVLSGFIVVLGLLIHKCKWERYYNQGDDRKHENKGKFDSSLWGTKPCNDYFKTLTGKGVNIIQLPASGSIDFINPDSKGFKSLVQAMQKSSPFKNLQAADEPLIDNIGSNTRLM